ncbi:hypothetical protein Tsubulata_028482 [Turnera subulata]|uniref:CHCH domain-containing protein n=1 Tax=Turnera subulata TaxID=218843 RepID=A0A9Q0J7J7_9ROSI|nr:hypothetical protein Tsubulata_028482 [Turnera subulata]
MSLPVPPNQGDQSAPLHSSEADDDNVKQLKQCSSVYLSLQDCLIDSNRDWKACQKGLLFAPFLTSSAATLALFALHYI